MFVGVLTVDLFLGESHSLKEKRRVIKSVTDRIKVRFNVSIAEIGELDTWQRSTLGIAMIGQEQSQIRKVLDAVVRFIEVQGALVITDEQIQFL